MHSLPETFIHTMFFFLNVLCFFSWDGRGHDLLFTHDTWLQLRTEPAQNAAGPGQRTNRNCFSYEQGGALRGGLGDWRVMEVRHRLEDVISSHVESRSRASVPASVGVQASFPGPLPTSFHSSACILPPSSSSLHGTEGSTGKEDKITAGLL